MLPWAYVTSPKGTAMQSTPRRSPFDPPPPQPEPGDQRFLRGANLVGECGDGTLIYEHSGFVVVARETCFLSLFNPTDPASLVPIYTRLITRLAHLAPVAAEAVADAHGGPRPAATGPVHFGGAGMTVPRALAALTGQRQHVVDIDRYLTGALVERYPFSGDLDLRYADAREHTGWARTHPVVVVDVCTVDAGPQVTGVTVDLVSALLDPPPGAGEPAPAVLVNVLCSVRDMGAVDAVTAALRESGRTRGDEAAVARWFSPELARTGRGNAVLARGAGDQVTAVLAATSPEMPDWRADPVGLREVR